jgi:hypothetical protein
MEECMNYWLLLMFAILPLRASQPQALLREIEQDLAELIMGDLQYRFELFCDSVKKINIERFDKHYANMTADDYQTKLRLMNRGTIAVRKDTQDCIVIHLFNNFPTFEHANNFWTKFADDVGIYRTNQDYVRSIMQEFYVSSQTNGHS